ncbi:MAG: hypothetical protein PHI35_08860, partial [Victivallaceae bacterium]|nr:hypothetical protein [Victivallaceae bacterium]
MSDGDSNAGVVRLDLGGVWSLRREKNGRVMPAVIPGDNCTAMLAAGEIDDPFFRVNEKNMLPMLDEDW